MKKTLLVWTLFLAMATAIFPACSTGDGEDTENGDIAEATSEGGELAEGEESAETTEGDMAASEAPPEDPTVAAPEEMPNEAPPEGGDAMAEADPNAAPPPPEEAPAPPADAPPVEQAAEQPSEQSGDLFGAGSTTEEAPQATEEKPRKKSSLKHIADAPLKRGGMLLNTVYIAREGDTIDGISTKIFGTPDKAKMLKKANPTLKRGVKTGDKVYFNSPNRSDDGESMKTVYEDQGLPPTTYVTKEGDTLRSLAQEWYGSEDSYKEIYAINKNLSSPKSLPEGTELIYWPASVEVTAYSSGEETMVAENNPPPEPPGPAPASSMAPPPPPPPAMPSPVDQMANMPPPPPPPPPGPDLNAPPPPPPPAAATAKKKKEDGVDKDTMMTLVIAGGAILAMAILMAMRRKNSRRNQGLTQV